MTAGPFLRLLGQPGAIYWVVGCAAVDDTGRSSDAAYISGRPKRRASPNDAAAAGASYSTLVFALLGGQAFGFG